MKEKINASAIPDAYLSAWTKTARKPLAVWGASPSNKSVIKWDYGGSSVPNIKRTKPATAPISALPTSRLMHSVSSGCWSRCPTGKCKKLPAGSWTISGAEHTIECAKANGLSHRTSKKAFWIYWNNVASVIQQVRCLFRNIRLVVCDRLHTDVTVVPYLCNGCFLPRERLCHADGICVALLCHTNYPSSNNWYPCKERNRFPNKKRSLSSQRGFFLYRK